MTPHAAVTPFWAEGDVDRTPRLFELHLGALDFSDRLALIDATLHPVLERHRIATGARETRPDGLMLEFEATEARAWALLRDLLARREALAADVAVVPSERGISLLLCDMDGTVVADETLDTLAARVGVGERVAAITDRAMRGAIDYRTSLAERTRLIAGIDPALLLEVAATARLSAGASELVAAARAAGVRTLLVTGGFAPIAATIARRLGFDDYVCNHLEMIDGRPSGTLTPPIIDGDGKRAALDAECQRRGTDPRAVCAVGDGANDIAMVRAAGVGIAYRAKPVLAEASPYRIEYADLSAAARWCGFPLQ